MECPQIDTGLFTCLSIVKICEIKRYNSVVLMLQYDSLLVRTPYQPNGPFSINVACYDSCKIFLKGKLTDFNIHTKIRHRHEKENNPN